MRLGLLLILAAVAGVLYKALLRWPILTWGATQAEAESRLPGDELLEEADGVSTRAIEIDAPASSVWPWLAQMGPFPRGGAYTYDWIENLLGLEMHSVDHVLPEFQHPEVGDTIGLGANRMRLERVEPQRVLAWRSEDGNWVWTFVLSECDGTTRLISRNRFRLPTLGARVGMLPMEPGSLLMERKMLQGIRQRAEHLRLLAEDRQVKVKTPLGEYPFEFSRLERRDGGLAVVGTVAGLESTVLFDRDDLVTVGRRLGPPLIAAAALLVILRRTR